MQPLQEIAAVFSCPRCRWAEDGASVDGAVCRRCGLAELGVTTVAAEMAGFRLKWCVPCGTWHNAKG